jgi:hypothetical protein
VIDGNIRKSSIEVFVIAGKNKNPSTAQRPAVKENDEDDDNADDDKTNAAVTTHGQHQQPLGQGKDLPSLRSVGPCCIQLKSTKY